MFSIDKCVNHMTAAVNPKTHIFTQNWIVFLEMKSVTKKEGMINNNKEEQRNLKTKKKS